MTQPNGPRASAATERVQAALDSGDRGAIEAALRALERTGGEDADAYLRGRLLTALGRGQEALDAYLQAVRADPSDARAHYSAGLALASSGDEEGAVRHWEAAAAADPGHVDALYNLGQAHYGRGRFAEALARWEAARALAPTDFEILKKVLQAQHAVGLVDEAAQTLAWLIDSWRSSNDPRVQGTDEVVVDQFGVDGRPVMAYRTLRPRSEDLHYLYTFRVFGADRKVLMTAQLESSAYGREQGVPFVLGVTTQAGHRTIGPAFKAEPRYAEVRELAARAIHEHMAL